MSERSFPPDPRDSRSSVLAEASTTTAREALESAQALGELRADVLGLLGPEYGFGVLFETGFREGMLDGLRVARGFHRAVPFGPRIAGPGLPMVFRPERGTLGDTFSGVLDHCCEARFPDASVDTDDQPGCAVTAGYASGWYSAILGSSLLVREVECVSRGEKACLFEARPIHAWVGGEDRWAEQVLPFLDLESIRERIAAELEPEQECESFASEFDQDSLAAHVWGPLLILPYTGYDDCEDSLEAVRLDPTCQGVSVAVVDVSRAEIDEGETLQLSRVLAALEEEGLELIVAGLSPDAAARFDAARPSRTAVARARDVAEAIALGFQLSQAAYDPD
jgi:hypothetical protein